jgi:hypothetical protein
VNGIWKLWKNGFRVFDEGFFWLKDFRVNGIGKNRNYGKI